MGMSERLGLGYFLLFFSFLGRDLFLGHTRQLQSGIRRVLPFLSLSLYINYLQQHQKCHKHFRHTKPVHPGLSPTDDSRNTPAEQRAIQYRSIYLSARDLWSSNRGLIPSRKGLVSTTLDLNFGFHDLHQPPRLESPMPHAASPPPCISQHTPTSSHDPRPTSLQPTPPS